MKNISRYKALLCAGLLALASVGCSPVSDEGTSTATNTANSNHASSSTVTLTEGKYSEEKLDASWDKDSSSTLSFKNDSIVTDDETIQIEGTVATITKTGTYILTGTLVDGQVLVDVSDKGTVKLVLDNVVLSSSTSSPLYIKNGDTIITLADGTENSLSDASEYVYEDEDEDEPGAVIFAKDDLTFNGNGTLTANGNYNHAIQSKNALKFVSGTYNISSVGDSLVGKDSVSIRDGNYTIDSGEDGIKATNTEESDKGYIIIENGTFHITSENDGIQAETLLRINDGEFYIKTGDGTAATTVKTDMPTEDMGGQMDRRMNGGDAPHDKDSHDQNPQQPPDERELPTDERRLPTDDLGSSVETDSAKALKSYVDLVIAGGTFTIDSCDDALHSDANLTINGGAINIQQCYEGLEGYNILINDGDIHIVSSDDGINAAGEDQAATLTINGGTIYVNAEGDGLDANGSIQINGGSLFAVGSNGMIQNPSEDSTQPFIAQNIGQTIPAGTLISVKDHDGNTIAEIETEKEIQWYAVSSPALSAGESYTVYIGEQETRVDL